MQARAIFFVLVAFLCISLTKSEEEIYYTMIEDISAGINYYVTLGVQQDAPHDAIRKAWRKLALTHHPDKNPDPANVAFFAVLKRAYEVVGTEASRKDYDRLLIQGIPWKDKYYGRYAHKYGAPDHDVRYVIFALIILITIMMQLYFYYRYQQIQVLAKKDFLKRQAKENKAKGIKKKKKYLNPNEEDEDDISGIPDIPIHGYEKPTWRDLFIVQIVYSPYWFALWAHTNGRWLYYCKIKGQYLEEFDEEEITRKQNGFSKKDWEEMKARRKQREQEDHLSNKNKRLRRYMKNRVIVNYLDD